MGNTNESTGDLTHPTAESMEPLEKQETPPTPSEETSPTKLLRQRRGRRQDTTKESTRVNNSGSGSGIKEDLVDTIPNNTSNTTDLTDELNGLKNTLEPEEKDLMEGLSALGIDDGKCPMDKSWYVEVEYGEEEEQEQEDEEKEDEEKEEGAARKAMESHPVEETGTVFDSDTLYTGQVADGFTDKGTNSYMMLVAVVTDELYKDAESDRVYIKTFIEAVGKHLKRPDAVIEAAQKRSRGYWTNSTPKKDSLVQKLNEETLVKKYGPQVIVYDLLDCIILQGGYDARSRTVVRRLSQLLKVEWEAVELYEDLSEEYLEDADYKMTPIPQHEKEKKLKRPWKKKWKEIAWKKKWKEIAKKAGVGIMVGGILSTVTVLTGGLAAGPVAAVLTAGGKWIRERKRDLEEFYFEPLTEGRQLHITIAVAGWLTDDNNDFKNTWRGLANSTEQYVLLYESSHLKNIGSRYLSSESKMTKVVKGLMEIISKVKEGEGTKAVIDNPWSLMMLRSALAGKELAEILLEREQGKRPVTLIGFSIGARVIFCCLRELAKRTGGAGIIENVILLGAPVSGDREEWTELDKVVAGRIINGYSRSDMLLETVYRIKLTMVSIAGLGPIDWEDRRMENIDLSKVVTKHVDYMEKIDEILKIVGVKTRPRPECWDRKNDPLRQHCALQRLGTIRDHRYNKGPKKQTIKKKHNKKPKSVQENEYEAGMQGSHKQKDSQVGENWHWWVLAVLIVYMCILDRSIFGNILFS